MSTSSVPQGELTRSDSSLSSSNFSHTDMEALFSDIPLDSDEATSIAPEDDVMFADSFPSATWAAVNQGVAQDVNGGTVSPQDLMRHDFISSAPSSTAFPNLDTPGSIFEESPYNPSTGLNTSPLEDGALDADLPHEDWGTLFPDASAEAFPIPTAPTSEPRTADTSFTSSASPMVRQKSSPGRPPLSLATPRKHSDVAGVKSAKSRTKPLPEIMLDEHDDKDVTKRKKNTAAARQSRARKLAYQLQLEEENQRLRQKCLDAGLDPDT